MTSTFWWGSLFTCFCPTIFAKVVSNKSDSSIRLKWNNTLNLFGLTHGKNILLSHMDCFPSNENTKEILVIDNIWHIRKLLLNPLVELPQITNLVNHNLHWHVNNWCWSLTALKEKQVCIILIQKSKLQMCRNVKFKHLIYNSYKKTLNHSYTSMEKLILESWNDTRITHKERCKRCEEWKQWDIGGRMQYAKKGAHLFSHCKWFFFNRDIDFKMDITVWCRNYSNSIQSFGVRMTNKFGN